uniref:Cell cycle link protein n=1 Tax=Sophora yellow stunt virus TaxID=1980160 RepID=A0A1W5YSD0_9VIRU|nr:cell cycle link protein [Sophora yellow stunt virus]QCF28423.1 cell cycle link protein [Sophora yellow stunt virus]QCF28424.1 cell cycle link protein [Sophora yellow stunt virus]QCF28425.1 cell cycle link protein [Sophora yellow stunt virus]WGT79562.1 cell cycle link protein [Sophora yellow stunt virus]
MDLKFVYVLPSEIKEKIYLEHMKSHRKSQILQKAIQEKIDSYVHLTQKEDLAEEEVTKFNKFLISLSNHYGNNEEQICLIKWKADVALSVKYNMMADQHWSSFGEREMVHLLCHEVVEPGQNVDVTYIDGHIVNCNTIEAICQSVGIAVLYIEIGRGVIRTPNCNI